MSKRRKTRDADDIELGKRIGHYRDLRRLTTQQQLGETIGASTSAIGNYERGDNRPKPFQIRAIAAALETTEGMLLGLNSLGAANPGFSEAAQQYLADDAVPAVRASADKAHLAIDDLVALVTWRLR